MSVPSNCARCRTASLLVGRPTLIPESSVDTLPPANLDDHDLLGDFPVEGKPMSQPTVMTHAVRPSSPVSCFEHARALLTRRPLAARSFATRSRSSWARSATRVRLPGPPPRSTASRLRD